MATSVSQPCRLRRRIFRCRAEPAGVCQYCGRPFCGTHGVVLDDGQEICSRKPCVAKRDDLEKHLSYKEDVKRRNAEIACGVPSCDAPLGGRCTRCQGYFCVKHVQRREEPYMDGTVRSVRMSTLCRHCWARRPIWLRT